MPAALPSKGHLNWSEPNGRQAIPEFNQGLPAVG